MVEEKDTPPVVAATALEGGFDTAIYAQGKRAKEAGETEENNPFEPDFAHQFESWAAGWAAGTAPGIAPLETDDAQTGDRQQLAGRAKKKSAADD